jgi:hypothetical protein
MEDAEYFFDLGMASTLKQKHEGAYNYFTKSIHLDGKAAETYYRR